MESISERIHIAADYIRSRMAGSQPSVAVILGSGLGKLGDAIENPIVIPYKEIPGFPESTAPGHKGNLIIGGLGGRVVMAMQGRFHYYEGHPMNVLTLPVRVMSLLGIKYLLVSNAAGGANPDFNVGDLMIIKDHINMMPNPLIGPNMDEFGTRFPDMTVPYDLDLIAKAEKVAAGLGISLRKGVYFATSGPSYETPAEVRFFRMAGADAVGMSTVPEVIVARHCGLSVFGMSVITNKSNYENEAVVLNDSDDVLVQGDIAASKMMKLFIALIEAL